MSTLLHITLDLPVKLNIIRDIKVKGEVKKVTYALVVHGVKSLENDDRGGLNSLGGIKGSVYVVVNGLFDGVSVLQGLDLLEHQVEVVLLGVKSGKSGLLTSVTVVRMVIIKTDDSGKIGNKGVGLPSILRIESSSKGSYNISSEDVGKTTHESGLSTTRVSGNSDNNGGYSRLKRHVKGRGGLDLGSELRHESRRGEGSSGGEKGRGGNDEFHFDGLKLTSYRICK
mmetsp:Transcript_19235/g.28327  ORF Transcript_19235/g.28327 Transcript_19235/m.28327 type:complete len:227 (+) Transcript_19235:677-1357(+)